MSSVQKPDTEEWQPHVDGDDVTGVKYKLTGHVFNLNNVGEKLTHTVEGDLSNHVELGKELAEVLIDQGAKTFINEDVKAT